MKNNKIKISNKELSKIKRKIKELSKNNKDDIPILLDEIKKKYNISPKQASVNNEFLNYM